MGWIQIRRFWGYIIIKKIEFMGHKLSSIIGDKVFVVAEVGKGFIQTEADQPVEIYLENAKELARLAKEAGADAVKFQTHTVEDEQANINVIAPHFKGADRYNWVKRNTLATPVWFWRELKRYCDEIGILFFSTPMSRGAARLLNEEVGVDLWKVGSGDILDFVMLDYLVFTGRPIIISGGMSTLEEVDLAVKFLKDRGADFALLHCVSKYPCPPQELQLQTVVFFENRYNVPIGFSDHSIGVDSALAAVALGAKIIEKHFSLSRDLWGSDHKVAMVPEELRNLVLGIRNLEKDPSQKEEYLAQDIVRSGLGELSKTLQPGEAQFRPFFRKTLVALCDIPAGAQITPDLIGAMRPQLHLAGLPSEKYEEVIGKTVRNNLVKHQPITAEMIV
ncbi:MAG: N-acetylneuraminate synthase family protein [Candidatus Sungbacteria bacterium]|uniref:N-acetylneuraminate synthase family protein n=1 Tax=Candidatus Sungiibacteriota bacterium TaxID=2750080 RepID=A0A931YDZ8_9BACT|nr:N-acetylneuraminate synthase family protein [Candidatus Sungbacteria bacterium]